VRIDVDGSEAWLIGDPHFGLPFNGTPLHRRGEREAMQLEDFRAQLRTPDVFAVVMVGDLFDKPFVPLTAVVAVANEVRAAALERPGVLIICLAGNHDKSRQLGVRGAWELFELAVGWMSNVCIVNEPTAIEGMMLYPWQWGVSAVEQVETYGSCACAVAIGHWDLKSFGGDDSHVCPAKMLRDLNPDVQIFSGHYHEPGPYEVDGIEVFCTGSMQPYTHGEDPDGKLYVTLPLEEALARAEELKDMCVRVVLQPGETLPQIDCLQLTQMRADAEVQEMEVSVSMGNFDIHAVLTEEFAENQVPDQVQDFIKERMGAFA